MPNRRRGAMPLLAATVLAIVLFLVASGAVGGRSAEAVSTEPHLQLRGDLRLPAGSGVGVARVRAGWIVSGPDALVRLDDTLAPVRSIAPAIPLEWRARGYAHLGDVDVAGGSVYTSFEQPDETLDRQSIARFDATTLRFVDAVEVAQHEIPFVAVDRNEHVAYSMDRADGAELLRYDIGDGWRPLPALGLGQTIDGVRGADVTSDAVWLSTGDVRHGVYRVDRRTGVVTDLGSAGHLDATMGGLDATPRGEARLHVAVADGEGVVLTGFGVIGNTVRGPIGEGHSGWPPVLVLGAVALVVAAGAAGAVLVYRAREGLRPGPRRT